MRSLAGHSSIGVAIGVALAAALACSPGHIGALGESPGNTAAPGAPSSPGTPGSLGTPGAPGTPKVTADQCLGAAPNPGPSFLRRLNRFEYDNTVRDLLGDTSNPSSTFPPEEKRLGFDNNATALQVSPALVEQYLTAAETLAKNAVTNAFSQIVPCDPAADGVDACATKFIDQFGTRAYRRTLTTDEATALKGVFDVGNKTDFQTGVRLVLEVVLQSAPFLYRVEFGQPPATGETVVRLTGYEMASRLSYLIWQSMPDDELLAAAAGDHLGTPGEIGAQVTRLLADPKAHDVFAHFHDQWLKLEQIGTIDKDTTIFSSFSKDLVPLMDQEIRQFLDYVVWQGEGTLDALLTSKTTFVNDKLATYYGISGVTGSTFSQVTLDDHHGGFLTQGGFLAMLGKANQTAPVQRGKFVREQLLCMPLKPPPANIMIKPPELSTTLSTRERFAAHRTDPICASCHELMDPIGLGFENFDGAGHFRTTENGAPIVATGSVEQSDITGTFDGVADLAQKLAGSQQVRDCVTTSWFRYASGRAETDDDACTLATVNSKFETAKHDLKSLLVALAESDSFQYRRVIPAGGQQ